MAAAGGYPPAAQGGGGGGGGSQRQGPPITVSALSVGENVDVFHRYNQDPNGYFMVQRATSGMLHPSVGKTDGWTTARVSEAWDISQFNRNDHETWVQIQWTHPKWYNRRGHKLDVSTPGMVTQRVLPEQIRHRQGPSEAKRQPCLTLFHVRWGGERPVDPVTEGAGGWGQIGAPPSDNYIDAWEDHIFQSLGPTYEIISAFVQYSDELLKLSPPLLRQMFRGQHIGAMYFLWPIPFNDGHEFPGFVDTAKLFHLMTHMEATGVPTRFPHASHLYRLFASKEWTAQTCLHPLLKVPLTTQVSRQAVACDPGKAASTSLAALSQLSRTREAWHRQLGVTLDAKTGPIQKGVVKLGWSWEATDVLAFRNKQELARSLGDLAEQPECLIDLLFVQEWVDFDVELRHFIIEPDLTKPETLKPRWVSYTVFKSRERGSFRNFEKFDRQRCLQTCFKSDDAALQDAERQSEEVIVRWLEWLQAQTHELPVVCRFDIMAKRTGPGRSMIMTGELTELGGCFLGWPQGSEVVFTAVLQSCFRDQSSSGS